MDDTLLKDLVLDLIPLTDEVREQNPMFGEMLQRAALEAYLAVDGPCVRRRLADVERLLQLSVDLGYTDADVFAYLDRQLRRIAQGCDDDC